MVIRKIPISYLRRRKLEDKRKNHMFAGKSRRAKKQYKIIRKEKIRNRNHLRR